MKHITFLLFYITTSSCFAQDTLLISSYPLTDKEMSCCKGVKNQLNCLDSLIQNNQKATKISGKVNHEKVYFDRFRKLVVYTYNAGFISSRRGNIEQAFIYFNLTEKYLDTLKQNNKINDFKDFDKAVYYQKLDVCGQTYFKDTSLFNQCNCAQFFPELTVEDEKTDTISQIERISPKLNNGRNLFGEFYWNDTLRFNNYFVSDSVSIAYFNQTKNQILHNLRQKQIYFEMFREPDFNLKMDTIIIKVSINNVPGSYERKCEVVHSSFQLLSDYFLALFGTMEFPYSKNSISFYIPLVITPKKPSNYNKMDKIIIDDDHILIEYEKVKPISTHEKEEK